MPAWDTISGKRLKKSCQCGYCKQLEWKMGKKKNKSDDLAPLLGSLHIRIGKDGGISCFGFLSDPILSRQDDREKTPNWREQVALECYPNHETRIDDPLTRGDLHRMLDLWLDRFNINYDGGTR